MSNTAQRVPDERPTLPSASARIIPHYAYSRKSAAIRLFDWAIHCAILQGKLGEKETQKENPARAHERDRMISQGRGRALYIQCEVQKPRWAIQRETNNRAPPPSLGEVPRNGRQPPGKKFPDTYERSKGTVSLLTSVDLSAASSAPGSQYALPNSLLCSDC